MPVPSDVQSRHFVMILIQVSHVCEIFDIESHMARNLTNLFKSNRRIMKDLKGFARFLSRAAAREPDERSDTNYHQHITCESRVMIS